MATQPQTRYYLDAGTFVVELHATSDIQISEKSELTEHPVITGSSISDHIFKKQNEIRLKGVITRSFDTTKFEESEVPEQIILKLRHFMDGTTTGNLHIDSGSFRASWNTVDYYPDVQITSMTRRRTKDTSNAWEISLTFKQVVFATQLTRGRVNVILEVDQDIIFKDQGESAKDSADTSILVDLGVFGSINRPKSLSEIDWW